MVLCTKLEVPNRTLNRVYKSLVDVTTNLLFTRRHKETYFFSLNVSYKIFASVDKPDISLHLVTHARVKFFKVGDFRINFYSLNSTLLGVDLSLSGVGVIIFKV